MVIGVTVIAAYLVAAAAAYVGFKAIRPKPPVETAAQLGRKWLAWMTGLIVFSLVVKVSSKLIFGDYAGAAEEFFIWLIAGSVWSGLAFMVGWGVGKYRFRKVTG